MPYNSAFRSYSKIMYTPKGGRGYPEKRVEGYKGRGGSSKNIRTQDHNSY